MEFLVNFGGVCRFCDGGEFVCETVTGDKRRYTVGMSVTRHVSTDLEHLEEQLANPSYEIVWNRATEVFDGLELARDWMNTRLPILNNEAPESYARSSDPNRQRDVLKILSRIDYGMYS